MGAHMSLICNKNSKNLSEMIIDVGWDQKCKLLRINHLQHISV